jgi:hypothetical protein
VTIEDKTEKKSERHSVRKRKIEMKGKGTRKAKETHRISIASDGYFVGTNRRLSLPSYSYLLYFLFEQALRYLAMFISVICWKKSLHLKVT